MQCISAVWFAIALLVGRTSQARTALVVGACMPIIFVHILMVDNPVNTHGLANCYFHLATMEPLI